MGRLVALLIIALWQAAISRAPLYFYYDALIALFAVSGLMQVGDTGAGGSVVSTEFSVDYLVEDVHGGPHMMTPAAGSDGSAFEHRRLVTVFGGTVFGGTGFLGRRIVRRLLGRGFAVWVAARHPERVQAGVSVG
jgi:hypothetical protein